MTKRRMSTFERLESGRLNRKQRRELERQVAAADPGLRIVHANAGGIDVGNESHYVAVPPDRDPNRMRTEPRKSCEPLRNYGERDWMY